MFECRVAVRGVREVKRYARERGSEKGLKVVDKASGKGGVEECLKERCECTYDSSADVVSCVTGRNSLVKYA